MKFLKKINPFLLNR